jgi:hypothetical protein
MENQNSLTNSILQTNSYSPSVFPETASNNSGFFSGIQNISFITWLIIILILAFLGFSIFVYLAKGSQDIKIFFNAIYQKMFGTTMLQTSKNDSDDNNAKEIQHTKSHSTIKGEDVQNTVQHHDQTEHTSLNKALNTSEPQEPHDDYQAHDASSSLDITGKAGWCYIGEDRGFRSCAQVGVNDKCMSGDIFPSQEICVNPNLRK